MLAKRRGFYRDGKEIIRTPLLLPSFSSKGFPHVQQILETTQEVIDGETLISAYDLHYGKIKGPFDFAQAVFIDSGGYEAAKDLELSDTGSVEHLPAEWNIDLYTAALAGWNSPRPSVVVSYDHPHDRLATADQIARADTTIPRGPKLFREILLKPEKRGDDTVNVAAIVENIHKLAQFDAIGVTEKEIGATQQVRMSTIARIRCALNAAGLGSMPIHVFGSLDTVSTPLYFVAGADIFDGLTWLRFAYHEGLTVYRQNFATIKFGTEIRTSLVDAQCYFQNYYYLKNLGLEMRNFLGSQSFVSFKHHHEIIERAYRAVIEETEVTHGR